MKKIVICVLVVFIMCIPFTYAHDDPPIMTLTLDPDMPDVNEPAQLTIKLVGSLTGFPTYGAIINVVIRNTNHQKEFRLKESEPGLYTGEISFPELEMWDMRVYVEHENELDFRNYMVHVMKPIPGYHYVLTDNTLLTMDKNATGQMIPPRLVLEGFIAAVVALLVIATVMKRRRLQAKEDNK